MWKKNIFSSLTVPAKTCLMIIQQMWNFLKLLEIKEKIWKKHISSFDSACENSSDDHTANVKFLVLSKKVIKSYKKHISSFDSACENSSDDDTANVKFLLSLRLVSTAELRWPNKRIKFWNTLIFSYISNIFIAKGRLQPIVSWSDC